MAKKNSRRHADRVGQDVEFRLRRALGPLDAVIAHNCANPDAIILAVGFEVAARVVKRDQLERIAKPLQKLST